MLAAVAASVPAAAASRNDPDAASIDCCTENPPFASSVIAPAALPADVPGNVTSFPRRRAAADTASISAPVAPDTARIVFKLLVKSVPTEITCWKVPATPPSANMPPAATANFFADSAAIDKPPLARSPICPNRLVASPAELVFCSTSASVAMCSCSLALSISTADPCSDRAFVTAPSAREICVAVESALPRTVVSRCSAIFTLSEAVLAARRARSTFASERTTAFARGVPPARIVSRSFSDPARRVAADCWLRRAPASLISAAEMRSESPDFRASASLPSASCTDAAASDSRFRACTTFPVATSTARADAATPSATPLPAA